MNLRSVDLNLLTVFDAVMTEGNITRAAEKIGMSQPAMSIAISRFRHIAKDKLFERTGRGVKPTPRAQQLAGPVRRALDIVSSALEHHTEFDAGQSERTFNLALGDYGELLLLPGLMAWLNEQNSRISIRTLSVPGSDVVKEMHFGNLDLYMWIVPLEKEEFTSLQLGSTEEVCLLHEDHPRVKNKLTLEQFAALKHIIFELPGAYGPSTIDRELWLHGLQRQHSMTVHSYFDVPRILSTTDMVCTMPPQMARTFAARHPLKVVPSPIKRELPIFLIWHKSMETDPGHRWLREYLIDLHGRL